MNKQKYFNIIINLSRFLIFIYVIELFIDVMDLIRNINIVNQNELDLMITTIIVLIFWIYLILKGIEQLKNIKIIKIKHYIISFLLMFPFIIIVIGLVYGLILG